MTYFNSKLFEVVQRDPRYAYEAYEFVFQALLALEHERRSGGEQEEGGQHHVTGQELLQGIRKLALREFGMLARTVFHLWGINRTDDFGEIVFNLVEADLMNKTAEDSREDFRNVFDLDQALQEDLRIDLDEAMES